MTLDKNIEIPLTKYQSIFLVILGYSSLITVPILMALQEELYGYYYAFIPIVGAIHLSLVTLTILIMLFFKEHLKFKK